MANNSIFNLKCKNKINTSVLQTHDNIKFVTATLKQNIMNSLSYIFALESHAQASSAIMKAFNHVSIKLYFKRQAKYHQVSLQIFPIESPILLASIL